MNYTPRTVWAGGIPACISHPLQKPALSKVELLAYVSSNPGKSIKAGMAFFGCAETTIRKVYGKLVDQGQIINMAKAKPGEFLHSPAEYEVVQ